MTEDLNKLIELSRSGFEKFEIELQKLEGDETKKALSVMNYASKTIKVDASMIPVMKYGIQILLQQERLSAFELLNIALGYEKCREYDEALSYYERCESYLPVSALKSAIGGMKCRVLSKKYDKEDYYNQAIAAFELAKEQENVAWKKQKWELACQEMKKQKVMRWRTN